MLKSVLFLLAGNVMTIYAIQLLQATSYTFLFPIQMYYANNKIRAADMVKGQAFSTASYTLGCAAAISREASCCLPLTFGLCCLPASPWPWRVLRYSS